VSDCLCVSSLCLSENGEIGEKPGEKGTAVHVEIFRVCGSDIGPTVEETGTKEEVEEMGMKEEVGKQWKWGPLGFEVRIQCGSATPLHAANEIVTVCVRLFVCQQFCVSAVYEFHNGITLYYSRY
jgi:hypothetical protein